MICFLIGLGAILAVVLALYGLGVLASGLSGDWDFGPEAVLYGMAVVAMFALLALTYILGCVLRSSI